MAANGLAPELALACLIGYEWGDQGIPVIISGGAAAYAPSSSYLSLARSLLRDRRPVTYWVVGGGPTSLTEANLFLHTDATVLAVPGFKHAGAPDSSNSAADILADQFPNHPKMVVARTPSEVADYLNRIFG